MTKQTGRVCAKCGVRRPMANYRILVPRPIQRDDTCLACRQAEEDENAAMVFAEHRNSKLVAKEEGKMQRHAVRERDRIRLQAKLKRQQQRRLRRTAARMSEAEREIVAREYARRRLIGFIERFQPRYQAGWVHHDICRRLEKFVKDVEDGKSPRLMLWVPPRHGKECASSTPVLTANRGWITHAELVPGDEVFHPSGRAIKVLARGEDNPHSPKYEVELTDGSTVRVHPNHEWTVYQRGNDRVSGWKTVETRYLASRNLWSGKRAVFQLPVVQAVKYPPQQLIMHPYVLGAWLGDGTATSAELTHHPEETEVVQAVVEAGYRRSRAAHYFSAGSTRTAFGGSEMTAQLRAMRVWGNKHIPQTYKQGSVSQRLELLAGLIDTDGHVEPGSSRVRISTASTQLRDDIAEVARSLGFRPYIHETAPSCSSSGVQGSCPVYQIGFQPTLRIPTRLQRKAITRLAPQRRIGIRAVRETAPETGQCIQVDHPDGLYLVGKTLVPTHNSLIASDYLPAWIFGKHPEWEVISTSYSKDLPMGFSRRIRERVAELAYQQLFPNTRLDSKVQGAEEWKTTAGGGYRAAGVGGGITGMGAHVFIIDDPVKDAEEADSETIREKTWDWYGSTAYTRLAPGGGMLVIQCMTGDTPVLMADGSEKRLDQVREGDWVATYDNGKLSVSTVRNWASNGHDAVYRITTNSGKTVRANGRHPFLVVANGELKWVRTRNLESTQRIVTLKGSGESGKVRPAALKGAASPPSAADSARRTITRRSGLLAIVLRPVARTPVLASARSSNIVTAFRSRITSVFSKLKAASTLFVDSLRRRPAIPGTGTPSSASTTATTLAESEDCSATTATSPSGTGKPLPFSRPLLTTSDFILDEIVSIVEDGIEEVFDVQIDRTENFIANGLVSHNTRWHDDDLSGRLERHMLEGRKEVDELRAGAELVINDPKASPSAKASAREGLVLCRELAEEIEPWEIVKYPAIATNDEHMTVDGRVTNSPEDKSRQLRKKGEALHPQRFDLTRLRRIKRALQPRHWSALYQQNPVPDEGLYFQKDMFRWEPHVPDWREMNRFCAWDLAIGTRQTHDWTVGIAGAYDWDGKLHILEMVRMRTGNVAEIAEAVVSLATRYDAELVGVEKGQLELALAPALKQAIEASRHWRSAVAEGPDALKPVTDKLMRARPLQGMMQRGLVYLPSDQEWAQTLVAELLRFPGGLHDDIVDACLHAHTSVSMASGVERRIDQVLAGDWVATPEGPRRVLAAGMTRRAAEVYRVTLVDGTTLTGTHNHPVYVLGRQAFVPLSRLSAGDELCPQGKESCIEGLPTIDTQGLARPPSGDTSTGVLRKLARLWRYIVGYGRTTSDPSPQERTSTTRMGIQETTILGTWSAWLRRTIIASTEVFEVLTENVGPSFSCSTQSATVPRSGTGRRRDDSGTGSMPGRYGRSEPRGSILALNAGRSLKAAAQRIRCCIAQPDAAMLRPMSVESQRRREQSMRGGAPSAGLRSRLLRQVGSFALRVVGSGHLGSAGEEPRESGEIPSSRVSVSASTVVQNTPPSPWTGRVFVPSNASSSTGSSNVDDQRKSGYALSVERSSGLPTTLQEPALQSAPRSTLVGGIENGSVVARVERLEQKVAVYNLEVEGCPTYYANGVLVHNCAWLARMVLRVTPPDRPGGVDVKFESWRDKLKEYEQGDSRHPMAV